MPNRFRFKAAKVARLVGLVAVLLCVGVLLLLGWRRAMLATSELKQLPVYPGAMSVSFGTRADCVSSFEDMASVSSFADLTFDTTDEPDRVVEFYIWELSKRGWDCSVSEGYRASIEPIAVCARAGDGLPLLKLHSGQKPKALPIRDNLSPSRLWRRVRIYEQEPADESGSSRISLFYSYFRFR
ncbi:MAG: hypothetical protein M3437_20800 [Chloroflexota bacterium]|nr:hypothetical protein [Chloroflexota bacterium]MDQ5867787.1 hypothetical protein [Chloroflexota bacterium]